MQRFLIFIYHTWTLENIFVYLSCLGKTKQKKTKQNGKEVVGMGAGGAHARGGDCFSDINSSQVIFLFRVMDTLGPREITSPG